MALSYWLYLLGGVLILAINGGAIYFAWRALFADRPRGRRRCPRCWHDLRHTPGMTCSECGFSAQTEAQFLRTRRHWGVATIAILTCVTLAGWLYWRLDGRGWTTYLPMPALTMLLPLHSDGNGALYQEVSRRASADMLDDGQWSALLRRCARGDWGSRPVTDSWADTYGQLIRMGRWRMANDPEASWDEDARRALLGIPPKIDLTTRESWPSGSTPRIRLRIEEWWPLGPDSRISIRPELEGAPTRRVRRSSRTRAWWSYSFGVDGLPPDAKAVRVDVEVERDVNGPPADGIGPPAPSRWTTMSRDTIEVPVQFSEGAGVDLVADGSRALTQAIWSTFNRGAVRWSSGPVPVRFYFTPQDSYQGRFDDVAVGVRVEVLRGDDLARRLDIWWLAGTAADDRGIGWEVHGEDPSLLESISNDPDWTMRVTSDPLLALRAGDALSYWEGQFTIPLRLQVSEGIAPRPLWVEEDADEDDQRSAEVRPARPVH